MLLGVLEQTGLVQRHYDVPQTLTIHRLPQRSGRRPDGSQLDRALYDFLQRANWMPTARPPAIFSPLPRPRQSLSKP